MRYLGLLGLLGVLVLTVRAAWRGWGIAPEAEMGGHGAVALLLGIGFSLALAAGLVGLMLYSRRRGLDR